MTIQPPSPPEPPQPPDIFAEEVAPTETEVGVCPLGLSNEDFSTLALGSGHDWESDQLDILEEMRAGGDVDEEVYMDMLNHFLSPLPVRQQEYRQRRKVNLDELDPEERAEELAPSRSLVEQELSAPELYHKVDLDAWLKKK